MKRVTGTMALILPLLMQTACSSQAWYEGMRMGAQQRCDRQAPGAAQACRDKIGTQSYDAYEKERSELQK